MYVSIPFSFHMVFSLSRTPLPSPLSLPILPGPVIKTLSPTATIFCKSNLTTPCFHVRKTSFFFLWCPELIMFITLLCNCLWGLFSFTSLIISGAVLIPRGSLSEFLTGSLCLRALGKIITFSNYKHTHTKQMLKDKKETLDCQGKEGRLRKLFSNIYCRSEKMVQFSFFSFSIMKHGILFTHHQISLFV